MNTTSQMIGGIFISKIQKMSQYNTHLSIRSLEMAVVCLGLMFYFAGTLKSPISGGKQVKIKKKTAVINTNILSQSVHENTLQDKVSR